MITYIKRYFECHLNAEDTGVEADPDFHLKRITSALLIEMVNADFEQNEAERVKVIQLLQTTFFLDQAEADELMTSAIKQVENSTSLHDFTSIINKQFDSSRKLHIIELLWEVAYADGKLDKYEDYLVRKIADLIGVSHSDFIKMKHKVQRKLHL